MCEKEIESGFKEELGFFLNRGNGKVGFVHIFDWLNVVIMCSICSILLLNGID